MSLIVTNLINPGVNVAVFALALVCLIYYSLQVWNLVRLHMDKDGIRKELSAREAELAESLRERRLARIENEILRSFLDEPQADQNIQMLLRHFIPNPQHGAAFYVNFQPHPEILFTRGVEEVSGEASIEPTWIRALESGRVMIFEGKSLWDSKLLLNLHHKDRDRIPRLYVFPLRQHDEVAGAIVTSELFPVGIPQAKQMEFCQGLVQGLERYLEKTASVENARVQLQSSQLRLEIGHLADRSFQSPMQMAQAILDQVSQSINLDRIALYLVNADGFGSLKTGATAGKELAQWSQASWMKHEDLLVREGTLLTAPRGYTTQELQARGIDTLIGSAYLVPLRKNGQIFAVLCTTRGANHEFTAEEQELMNWVTELLSRRLFIAVQHARVERESRQDPLTGLANRRCFDVELKRELQAAHATYSELSLIMIDVDKFKSVNDTYGHLGGDHVLKIVSQVIQDCVSRLRSEDRAFCARYGGEEMSVVLPGIGQRGCLRVADVIRQKLEQTEIQFQGQKFRVTLSAGVATFPEHGTTPEALISAADAALYEAKQAGRNRVCMAGANTHSTTPPSPAGMANRQPASLVSSHS